MKLACILGWAIPERWFAPYIHRAFPSAQCEFLPAAAATSERLADVSADLLIGYSLGAQLVLGAADRMRARPPIGLLAPIFAFPAERGLGGRVSRTQVGYLARWLRRDPAAALQDFYHRAGLDVPAALAPIDDHEALSWGLDQLLHADVPAQLPENAVAVCGADDSLLDAARLRELEPRVDVVAGATHHPATLLPALIDRLPRTVTGAASPC
jgi:hypothetical protein